MIKIASAPKWLSGHDLTLPTKRWWEPISAFLLLLALSTATARLLTTRWTEELTMISAVMLLGYAVGLALGQSRFSPRLVVGMAIAYGLIIISWQLGLTFETHSDWPVRMLNIKARLYQASQDFFNQVDINDPILFLTLMAIIYWAVSIHAAYSLTRHGNPWLATLPGGILTFLIHLNDPDWPRSTWLLGLYIILGMLITARLYFIRLNASWQQNHTRVPMYLSLDMMRAALMIILPIILLAWLFPATLNILPKTQEHWLQLSEPWRKRIEHLFASLKTSATPFEDIYPNTLILGKGSNLSDDIVMTIIAPKPPYSEGRYYWRGSTYDYYLDGQWSNAPLTSTLIKAELFAPTQSKDSDSRLVNLKVTPYRRTRLLYTIDNPIAISQAGYAQIIEIPDGPPQIKAFLATSTLQPGDAYEVTSLSPLISSSQLINAGEEYPNWVINQYLQVPDNITQRTRDLAKQIAQMAETPYDKVVAVTNYLRTNITYQNAIDPPPTNQERIDWLLFDYQRGYCHYYASAEVILLRLLGIPARLAVGYTQGEISHAQEDASTGNRLTYIVRKKNLHSWPEVYFAEIGWVVFEPTANLEPVQFHDNENLPIISTSGSERGHHLEDSFLPSRPHQQFPTGGENPSVEITPEDKTNIELTVLLRNGLLLLGLALLPIPVLLSTEKGYWMLLVALPALVRKGLATLGISLPQRWNDWVTHQATRLGERIPLSTLLIYALERLSLPVPSQLLYWSRMATLPPLTRAYLEINKALSRLGHQPAYSDTPAERAAHLVQYLPQAQNTAYALATAYQSSLYGDQHVNVMTAIRAARQIRWLSYLTLFKHLVRGFKI